MSTPNEFVHTGPEITGFYTQHLKNFGDSPKGVGWKNDQAQDIRFIQLAKIIENKTGFSVNDLGCGTGKFYKFLLAEKYTPAAFNGYDILEEMIAAARVSLGTDPKINL